MSDDHEPDWEEIGYKRPPRKHQFKKNTSGNPKGRPRRKTNFDLGGKMDAEIAEAILAEAGRLVSVRENGKAEELSVKIALLRSLNHSAMKGDLRSQVEALKLILAAERMKQDQKGSWTCPKCSADDNRTSAEVFESILHLLDSGKVKLPSGYDIVAYEDNDDDPHGVG